MSGFDRLVKKIEDHVDYSSNTSRKLHNQLLKAGESLREVKLFYHQQLVVYSQLKDILAKNKYGIADDAFQDESDAKFYGFASEVFGEAEAKSCVNLSPVNNCDASMSRLFGLTQEDFVPDRNNKKVIHQHLEQVLTPILESNLKDLSLQLYKFWNPSNNDSEGLQLAKANQLTLTLSNVHAKIKENKNSLRVEENRFKEVWSNNYRGLLESIDDLQKKIAAYEGLAREDSSKVNAHWLSSKCNYIIMKIKMMRNHLYMETYTQENIEALSKVRAALTEEIKNVSLNLERSKRALAAYKSIGPTFHDMLQEYTRLTTHIDNKKWALAELQKNTS